MKRKISAKKDRTSGPDAILRMNIALQGGGSHGAFAWGVLDRLLEEQCYSRLG
jgi:NTE family protein